MWDRKSWETGEKLPKEVEDAMLMRPMIVYKGVRYYPGKGDMVFDDDNAVHKVFDGFLGYDLTKLRKEIARQENDWRQGMEIFPGMAQEFKELADAAAVIASPAGNI